MSKLIPTDDLQNYFQQHVKNTASLNDFFNRYANDCGEIAEGQDAFSRYFFSLVDPRIESKELTYKNLYDSANINKSTFDKIKNGSHIPKRDNILALCITAKLSLTETNRCLELTQRGALYHRNRRDAIIIYAIDHSDRYHSLIQVNQLLDDFNQPLINCNG